MLRRSLSLLISVLVGSLVIGIPLALAESPASSGSPETDFLSLVLSSVGGWKGATALTLVVSITQLGMAFMRTKWSSVTGRWKFLIVTGFSLVGGVAALMAAGQPFMAALLDAGNLAILQVFVHQFYKQVTEKPEAQPPSPSPAS